MFADRLDAAKRLADALAGQVGPQPLVLAIPRGAVPMGAVVAHALGGDLDVVLVHKIGAPGNPEFAIGAVSEDGDVQLDPTARQRYAGYLDDEITRQQSLLRARRERYTPLRPPVDPAGREVVVIDDGSATGATMKAALASVRRRRPQRLVAALAVAPPDVVAELRGRADAVVCLETPRAFLAVGCFFSDFRQVSDQEVEALLAARAG